MSTGKMGHSISYYRNDSNKGLKDLIVESYSEFRQWYLDRDKSSIEEYNEPFGSEELKIYFRKESDFISGIDRLDAQLLDELTSEFIAEYCDLSDKGRNIFKFFGPSMSTWRYEKSSKMVLAVNDKEFLTLWNYLLKGRSLSGNQDFKNYTNDFSVGFLNRQEAEQLENKIKHYFGDRDEIRKKYWTQREKRQLEDAMANSKDGSYELSGHNPKSSGLEYVLEALGELTTNNLEIITAIG